VVWLSGLAVEVEELDQEAAGSLERVRRSFQMMYPTVPFMGRIDIKHVVANPTGGYRVLAPDHYAVRERGIVDGVAFS
jgi:hypothetical protein